MDYAQYLYAQKRLGNVLEPVIIKHWVTMLLDKGVEHSYPIKKEKSYASIDLSSIRRAPSGGE